MREIKFIIAITMMLFSAALTQAQPKRALVVGLGQQEDKSWAKINGDRDVPLVKEMLTTAGYKDIKTLVNKQATKAAIVKAFGALASRCKKGDVVYIHFSGHGQQMTDREGDEKDGWDEAWIPYDAYLKYGEKDKGEKHLSDDEIGSMLDAIKARIGDMGQMVVVIDACHSGSGTRDMDSTDVVVRGVWDKFIIPNVTSVKAKKEVRRQGWLTVSACKDYQSNFELKGRKVGKLTYALWQLMKGKGKLSNKDVEEKLRRFMLENPGRSPQTPVMSGATDKNKVCEVLRL